MWRNNEICENEAQVGNRRGRYGLLEAGFAWIRTGAVFVRACEIERLQHYFGHHTQNLSGICCRAHVAHERTSFVSTSKRGDQPERRRGRERQKNMRCGAIIAEPPNRCAISRPVLRPPIGESSSLRDVARFSVFSHARSSRVQTS